MDHTPISPAYAYRFDYKGRSVLVTGDLKYQPSLLEAARGVDLIVSEAIATAHDPGARPGSIGCRARTAPRRSCTTSRTTTSRRSRPPRSPTRQAPSCSPSITCCRRPTGSWPGSVFAQGIDDARKGDWTIADDGSLYTLPLGSDRVEIGRMLE